jgi:hypothetical protein
MQGNTSLSINLGQLTFTILTTGITISSWLIYTIKLSFNTKK